MTDQKLKSCPFCGCEAVHQNHSARPGEYWYANSFVRCPNCKASGPIGSQDEAVTAWNRRAASSLQAQQAVKPEPVAWRRRWASDPTWHYSTSPRLIKADDTEDYIIQEPLYLAAAPSPSTEGDTTNAG